MDSVTRWIWLSALLASSAAPLFAQSAAPAPDGGLFPANPMAGPSHPSIPSEGADGPYWLDISRVEPTEQAGTNWYADIGVGILKPYVSASVVSPGLLNPSFAHPCIDRGHR